MWRSFALSSVAIASGCHIVFPIEPLAPPQIDGSVGITPKVFSSPGPAAAIYGGYPAPFSITLAADVPGTIIYYTTDGTPPNDTTSPSGITPVKGIMISAASTTVRFFGDHEGARSTTTSETYAIDTGSQSDAGYLTSDTTLDGVSPVVIAAGGTQLSARTSFRIWVQPSCSACGAQLVYGVGIKDDACLYEGSPGVYGVGTSITNKTFTVDVPPEPGVHEVRVAHIEANSCMEATAPGAMTLATRPTVARIGVIVVP